MGFGDKLKEIRQQAQQVVVDRKDQIQHAVDTVGDVANQKTKGKYADRIAKVGEKANAAVDKLGTNPDEQGEAMTGVADDAEADASISDGEAAAAHAAAAEAGHTSAPPADAQQDPDYQPPSFS